MPSQRLSNHLRKYRKRFALSQRDVAYLLGVNSSSKVCRYERFTREPGLYTSLAYEAIFRRPTSELFPGIFERIETAVKARAKRLLNKNNKKHLSQLSMRKCQTLEAIAGTDYKLKSHSR